MVWCGGMVWCGVVCGVVWGGVVWCGVVVMAIRLVLLLVISISYNRFFDTLCVVYNCTYIIHIMYTVHFYESLDMIFFYIIFTKRRTLT